MANKFANDGGSFDQNIKKYEQALAAARAAKRTHCFHNGVSGAKLIPVSESKLSHKDKERYSNTTYVCSECGEVIETAPFSPEDIRKMMFNQRSMLGQIRIVAGAKFDESDKKELDVAFESLDYLDNLF